VHSLERLVIMKNFADSQCAHLRFLSVSEGVIVYLSYGMANKAMGNLLLISLALFFSLTLSSYCRLSNFSECSIYSLTGSRFLAKAARFALQAAFNVIVCNILLLGSIIPSEGLATAGGLLSAAVMATFNSQASQYVAVSLARAGIGEGTYNVAIAVFVNGLFSALALSGVPVISDLYWSLSVIVMVIFAIASVLKNTVLKLHV
jgi:hypothetical protein